ncbi:MAG TPA: hypothetical protein VLA88_06610 [Candidatus Saccharimonadales bacterium]|nr:hypothetical protein [Candidatus Saccharimonadales bacterium]
MKTVLKTIARTLALTPALALALSLATPVATYAATATCGTDANVNVTGGPKAGAGCAAPAAGASNLFGPGGVFITITNILLFIIGAIAVVMLIIGGIRYVVSSGDQNAVTSAKNTILYAIIGIVVAFLAYAAVNFVTSQLKP